MPWVPYGDNLIERLHEILHYDPLTGIFTWKAKIAGHAKVGERAGAVIYRGYRGIGIGGQRYKEHRLAWFYVYGKWPPQHLDHLDRNPANNAIGNLREATPSQNQGNRRAKNKAQLKGTTRHWNKWAAQITKDRYRHYLGLFNTEQEAHAAYVAAAARLFGEFARAE